ncbi:hypothetical protein B0T17DRAFT_503360 [Bombardia bombarda]|uniref:Uncharacterized protein n=1 Tax=Bombardia bombarda TaxID=252184 RepID=A0AA39XLM9_9PEZI|nr:hypothetical protein B0T17DRAFT_503360 [Bombardia bombarda]
MALGALPTVFAVLSGVGFFLLWGNMSLNGGSIAMFKSAWTGVFPDGTTLQNNHSGSPYADFGLNVLIAFFASASRLGDVDAGPFLILLDLTTCLLVINMAVLVESRRRTGFWMKSPAIWQYLWNCGGVAVFLPLWSLGFVKQRALAPSSLLSIPEAQALPLTALISPILEAPLFYATYTAAGSLASQKGVILFFLGPPLFSLFQTIVASTINALSIKPFGSGSSPIKTAYWITAIISSAAHVATVAWAATSTDPALNLGRVYFPHGDAVKADDPNMLTEAAHLFLQWDFVIINATVLILGAHLLGSKSGDKAASSNKGSVATLVGLTAVFGPGAGLAYALNAEEDELEYHSKRL